MFDPTRAKTYARGALSICGRSSDAALYFKPQWGNGKAKAGDTIPPELATFLQKGLGYDPEEFHYDSTPTVVQQFLMNGLTGLGYGTQIMPGEHFTMIAKGGDVYGCASDPQNPAQPLAYRQALSEDAITAGCRAIQDAAGLTNSQVEDVRFALRAIGQKHATLRAYKAETEADCEPIETVIAGKVESVSCPHLGDWLVQQANGEFMVILGENWDKFGFVEVEVKADQP